MAASTAHKAVSGTGWAGVVVLVLDRVEEWLHPTTVQILSAQYSENLRIIAEACGQ